MKIVVYVVERLSRRDIKCVSIVITIRIHIKKCRWLNRDGSYEHCKQCASTRCPKKNIISDPVNNPAHYTDGKIEVIEYIEDKKLGFCLGNAIKYISRAGKKDPNKEIEDLKKAKWYIERRIKEIREAIV